MGEFSKIQAYEEPRNVFWKGTVFAWSDKALTKEGTEVSGAVGLGEDSNEHASSGQELVSRDDRSSNVIFVSQPAGAKCHDGGENVRRGAEKLALCCCIAHAISEDNRKEVGIGIAGQCRGHQVEPPEIELPVFEVMEDYGEGDWIFIRISAVGVDTVDNECLLFRIQEFVGFGGEVYDDEPSKTTHDNGHNT
jgi:hypothetical protein